MPKTTIDLPSEILAQLEKLQKEKGFEYLKDAYLYAIKHGLGIIEKAIEQKTEQTIQIREPIPQKPLEENEIPPCPYASLKVVQTKNGLDYYSYCDNPKKTNLPKNRLLPTQACQKCYQRENIVLSDIRKALAINAYCGYILNISNSEDMKKLKKTLKCLRDDDDYYKDANGNISVDCQECPLFSKEMRELVVQYFL